MPAGSGVGHGHGAGMDAEASARTPSSLTTKTSGTASAPIAKRNVELNGGTIAIESWGPNEGRLVMLRLPAYRPLTV
jgi:hypothetical protein